MPSPLRQLHTLQNRLDDVLAEVIARYSDLPNFSGADIGLRRQGGRVSNEWVVRLHVRRKRPLAELKPADIFPRHVGGIPLDIIEAHYVCRRDTLRPTAHRPTPLPNIMGGASVGRLSGVTGTAGVLAVDRRSGRPGILSSWQVLAGWGAVGGDPILHPGLADADISRSEPVASLTRWFCDAQGDGAFALFAETAPWVPMQVANVQAVSSARDVYLGEKLTRLGRALGGADTMNSAPLRARAEGAGLYRVFYEVEPGNFEARKIWGTAVAVSDRRERGMVAPEDELLGAGHQGALWTAGAEHSAVGLQTAESQATGDLRRGMVILSNMRCILKRLELELCGFEPWLNGGQRQDRALNAPSLNAAVSQKGRSCTGRRWGTVEAFLKDFGASYVFEAGEASDRSNVVSESPLGIECAEEAQSLLAVWGDLRKALQDRGFANETLRLADPFTCLQLPEACLHDALAETIRRLPHFPDVEGGDLKHLTLFVELCQMLRRGQ